MMMRVQIRTSVTFKKINEALFAIQMKSKLEMNTSGLQELCHQLHKK